MEGEVRENCRQVVCSGTGQLRGIKKNRKEDSDQSEMVLWRKFISWQIKGFELNLYVIGTH